MASAPPPVETAPPVASVAPTPPASASAPPPAVATYPTPSFPKKPKTFLPKHGQEAWAVYLAAFEKIGPEFNAATSAWIKTDLAVASGDIECDDGAKGKVKGAFVVRTYLRTEAEAKAFAKETKPEPAGVFKVKAMCAD